MPWTEERVTSKASRSRWFRFYSEALDDPKVQRLSPPLFKAWINLLCLAATRDGDLPSADDIAFRLRISAQDAQSYLDELTLAGLLDITPDKRLRPHNWQARQYASDSAAERMRRHRAKKKKSAETAGENAPVTERDVTGDAPVTAQTQTQTQNRPDSETVPTVSEQDAARADEQFVDLDLKGRGKGAGMIRDALTSRAEGLGLPVAELAQTTARARPRCADAYFRKLCVNRLRDRAPRVSEAVIVAALDGSREAFTAVSLAILEVTP